MSYSIYRPFEWSFRPPLHLIFLNSELFLFLLFYLIFRTQLDVLRELETSLCGHWRVWHSKVINSCPNNFKIGMENLYGLALVHAKFSNDRILITYFYPASRDWSWTAKLRPRRNRSLIRYATRETNFKQHIFLDVTSILLCHHQQ